MNGGRTVMLCAALTVTLASTGVALANAYRPQAQPAQVGDSAMSVVPPRDWNRLSIRPGKRAETWTLDGEQLNDVTFYAGIAPGEPLVRERNRKREPLPKFTAHTLLAEVPELLEGTYRAFKQSGAFSLTWSAPGSFLSHPGVHFTYEYTDADLLPRKGEAQAAMIGGKLYMATYDAPRLHFFEETVDDYRALAATATLSDAAPAKP